MSFPRLTLTQAVVGGVVSLVAVKLARPLLVEAVRAGFMVKDMAEDGYSRAKSEMASVKADARAPRTETGMSAEIAKLQQQVHALQSQIAKKA